MSKQQQPCVITCQLCGKTVTVNMHLQRMKYCRKCDKKLNEVGLKVEAEINKQRTEAKPKVAAKATKPTTMTCPSCTMILECPKCSEPTTASKAKKVTKPVKKAKKPVVRKGGKNVKRK